MGTTSWLWIDSWIDWIGGGDDDCVADHELKHEQGGYYIDNNVDDVALSLLLALYGTQQWWQKMLHFVGSKGHIKLGQACVVGGTIVDIDSRELMRLHNDIFKSDLSAKPILLLFSSDSTQSLCSFC